MVEFPVVVHIQCCVGHADIDEGEAGLIAGWFACVTDGCVDCSVAQWVVVGWGRIVVNGLVGGKG